MRSSPEPGCELCRDLDVVRYDWRAEERPAPFCGRCGRELAAHVVDAGPREALPQRRASS